MEILGRRVLITGAGRGLGRHLVLACARAGAVEVVAAARRAESLASLKAEEVAGSITPLVMDVTLDDQVRQAAVMTGAVDILINNAGVLAVGGVFKAPMDRVRAELEVNYLGLLRVTRAFVPAMIARGGGLIVNIGSHLGKVSLPLIGTYCALKAALFSIGQAMRGDLVGTGVHVITVAPGTLDTDMSRGFDVPKADPAGAAAQILEVIRKETPDAPIGDEARATYARLASDPEGLERDFGRIRA